MHLLMNPTVVIMLQCIHESNHHTVYLKPTQCYMSVMSQGGWEGKKEHPHSREMAAHEEGDFGTSKSCTQ